MFSKFCCDIEIPLAKCRSSAAAPMFHERHFKSERFQYFHSGHPDVRLVIPHEGVVPKNDCASVPKERRFVTAGAIWRSPFLVGGVRRGGRPTMSAKPFVEAFTCIMGQRPSSGDFNCFLHGDARRLETEKPIRQPWHETAEFA